MFSDEMQRYEEVLLFPQIAVGENSFNFLLLYIDRLEIDGYLIYLVFLFYSSQLSSCLHSDFPAKQG